MNKVSSFSERLNDAMIGMSSSELARFLGISKQSVSAYLSGTRCPKQLTISAIAQALDLNPAWLMGYDAPKRPSKLLSDNGYTLNDQEKLIIDIFRAVGAEGQAEITRAVLNVRDKIEKNAAPADQSHTAG